MQENADTNNDLPRYITIAEEMDEFPMPGATYKRIIFRWSYQDNCIAAASGDWDWFQHWPFYTRLRFALRLIFGRKMYNHR